MNNRIKQLALQAGEWVNDTWTPPVRSKEPGKMWEDGHVTWHDLFHQKFAELIVEDCLTVAKRDHKLALELEWDADDTARTIRDSISEHFGVKQ